MQIAATIARQGVTKPSAIKTEHYRLIHEKKNTQELEPKKIVSDQEKIDAMKRRFMAKMTMPVTIKDGDKIIDTYVPPLIRQRKIIEEQQAKIRQAMARQKQSKPPQSGDNNNVGGTRGVSRKTVGGRNPIHPNARRGKKDNGINGNQPQ